MHWTYGFSGIIPLREPREDPALSTEPQTPSDEAAAPLKTSPDIAARCPFSIPMHQDEVLIEGLDDQFDAMRKQGSLAWTQFPYGTVNDGKGWVATRFKDVKAILNDPRFSLAKQADDDYPRARVIEVGGPFPHSFVVMDPPSNAERRRTLLKHLTPERVKALRPVTERLVDECLDEIEAEGQGADLLPGLVRRVPLLLLCELLGAPPEERHIYVDYAHNYVSSKYKTVDDAMEALDVIKTYFAELCRRKRIEPGDDLISALQHDIEVKGLWTNEELEGFGFVLLTAGHDSTASFISATLFWLLHNPEVFARLRAEPDLVPKAVEEFLRLIPIGVPGTRARVALEDVQVGDTLVRRNESILAVPHAGNLDPSVYSNPREFDLDRKGEAQHIGFGFGPHFCVGSLLAKMDIEMVIRGLTRRFATLEPAHFDPDWQIRARTRGPVTMKVRWTT